MGPYLPQTTIKPEWHRRLDLETSEIGVARVEHIVGFLRNHGRRDDQDGRPSASNPLGANIDQRAGWRVLLPVFGEVTDPDDRSPDTVGNIGSDRHEVIPEVIRFNVNERFQGRQSERGRGVHDGGAGVVPPPTPQTRAFAIEGDAQPP